MTDTIVLGAGIVGISSALALQKKGVNVTLVDRSASVEETSYGNAGVITMESIIPLNNPQLFRQLPGLLMNRSNGLRYSLPYVFSHARHFAAFLYQARGKLTHRRIDALQQLLSYSKALHKSWMQEAGCLNRLRENGWLQLYRTEKSYRDTTYLQSVLQARNIKYEVLNHTELLDLEPFIRTPMTKAIWVKEASSVDNPAQVGESYKQLFLDNGGQFLQAQVSIIAPNENQGWTVSFENQKTVQCKNLVVALGPWSAKFLQKTGLKVPMIYERGSHRVFRTSSEQSIFRPIYDVEGGYVVTPMSAGIRLTCGVELNELDAPRSTQQLEFAEAVAKETFPIEEACLPDWHGCRPTVPDSLPVIGQSRMPGLWLNTAHQHIGFASGPASGEVLASLMLNTHCNEVSASLFSPGRFGL